MLRGLSDVEKGVLSLVQLNLESWSHMTRLQVHSSLYCIHLECSARQFNIAFPSAFPELFYSVCKILQRIVLGLPCKVN
jgi:hypothetical protein